MISAVLFDLDETLLDRTGSLVAFLDDQYRRFEDRIGPIPFERWRDRFLALDSFGQTHKSIVYPTLLAELTGEVTAADALLSDYYERCHLHARAFPGTADTLKALRGRGAALAIVTNGETEFQSRHIEALGLDELVDEVLVSQAEGLRKPAAAMFLRAAKRLGVPPTQCLFVGDNPIADIAGAQAVGMRTAWLRNGRDWPGDVAASPSVVIDTLPQVLGAFDELRIAPNPAPGKP